LSRALAQEAVETVKESGKEHGQDSLRTSRSVRRNPAPSARLQVRSTRRGDAGGPRPRPHHLPIPQPGSEKASSEAGVA